MNDNILKFPQNKCCQCDKLATHKIALNNADTCEFVGYKYFCDEHKVIHHG